MAANEKQINPGSIQLRNDFYEENKHKNNPKQQAQDVYEKFKKEIQKNPDKKIAILYAANGDQVAGLNQQYNNGGVYKFGGSGQADFMSELNRMIENDPELKNKVKILPIATKRTGAKDGPDNYVDKASLDRDLDAVEDAILDGFTVYGSPDLNDKSRYGIGGGAAKDFMDIKNGLVVQGKTHHEPISRNCYVQTRLSQFQAKYGSEKKANCKKLLGTDKSFYTESRENIEQLLSTKLSPQQWKKFQSLRECARDYVAFNNSGIQKFNPFHGEKGAKEAYALVQEVREGLEQDPTNYDIDARVEKYINNVDRKVHEHSFPTMLMKNYVLPKLKQENTSPVVLQKEASLKQVRDNFHSFKIEANKENGGNEQDLSQSFTLTKK